MGLLTDSGGNASTMRLTFIAWAFAVLLAWGWACFNARALVPIPESVIGLLGVLTTGKVAQTWVESSTGAPK